MERIKITYVPGEDRLELCIFALPPPAVQRIQLTRRITRRWLAQLGQIVELSAQPPASSRPDTRAAIARLHHEALASQATFARSADDADLQARVAQAPVRLAAEVNCGRSKQDGRWVIQFAFGNGESVSLALSSETMHGVIQLLVNQLQAADWQLDLPVLRTPVVALDDRLRH